MEVNPVFWHKVRDSKLFPTPGVPKYEEFVISFYLISEWINSETAIVFTCFKTTVVIKFTCY